MPSNSKGRSHLNLKTSQFTLGYREVDVKMAMKMPRSWRWSDRRNPVAETWRSHNETGWTTEEQGKHERQELQSSLQVSVGGCGMWGVAKDNSLWFRVGTAGRTAEWAGDNWTKVCILTSTIT